MRAAIGILVLGLAAGSGLALADDQPITGAKLQLKQSSSGRQKLVFQSKDTSVPFPPIGSADDPGSVGATIEIISPGVPPGAFGVPRNSIQPGWTAKFGAVHMHKYKRDQAFATTIAIKSVVMKNGRGISIVGDATGIPLDGVRGTVGIRITVGNLRSCVRFGGATVTKDVAGAFLAKGATTDGLADCAVTSITGQPPTCGDGDVNQPSEHCEMQCPDFPSDLTCRPPGTSNECSCCSDGWPSAAACCNPSSIAVIYPPQDKVCVPTRCDPPDSCRAGDQCQGDGSCCSVLGGNTCVMAYAPPLSYLMVPLVACCPGLECRRVSLPQGAVCCAAGGTSCAGGSDCCTGHCQLDGTCETCRSAAASCTTGQECCSGSCTSGTCDACAPTGTSCTAGATCCSGTCTSFRCE